MPPERQGAAVPCRCACCSLLRGDCGGGRSSSGLCPVDEVLWERPTAQPDEVDRPGDAGGRPPPPMGRAFCPGLDDRARLSSVPSACQIPRPPHVARRPDALPQTAGVNAPRLASAPEELLCGGHVVGGSRLHCESRDLKYRGFLATRVYSREKILLNLLPSPGSRLAGSTMMITTPTVVARLTN